MPTASLRAFGGGLVPRMDKRLLRDDQAQIAQNAVITSGALEPLRDPLDVYSSSKAGSLLSAHRLTAANGSDVWLAWTTDVDAARAPLGDDPDQRVYYTGDGEPRVTNLAMATSLSDNKYPDTCYVLGVPRPSTALTLGSVTGGTGDVETRAYTYCFVAITVQSDGSTLEEAGPPAEAVTGSGRADGTWPLSNLPTTLNNSNTITTKSHSSGISTIGATSTLYLRVGEYVVYSGNRYRITEITSGTVFKVADPSNAFGGSGTWTRDAPHNTGAMVKRIFRTDSAGTYKKVADVALATTTYNDSALESALPGPVLESAAYYQPPTNLTAIISLPNGCLAGIAGRKLCYSEPYQPHAWPPTYQKNLDWPGVSLGSLGTTVVVTTTGSHYIATGSDPSAVTPEKAKTTYPCLSKRGTVSTPFGVAWPTFDGIALQTPSGVSLLTEGQFTRREWDPVDATSIVAAVYGGRYIALYQPLGSSVKRIMQLNPGDSAAYFEATPQAAGLYADPRTGSLYLLQNAKIQKWDTGVRAQMDWMSKEFVRPYPMTWGAAKVDVSFKQSVEEVAALQAGYDAVAAENVAVSATSHGWKGGEISGMGLCMLPISEPPLRNLPVLAYEECGFYLYANGVPKHYHRVTSERAFRLPSGYLADNDAVRIISNVTVRGIILGTSMQALREG